MKVEIDQSGKLEQLDTKTVVAYANGKSGAVMVTAAIKRMVVQQFRKSLIPEKHMEAILFAILVFLLIKDLPNGVVFIIDEEYTGKNEIIEEALTKLLQQKFTDKWCGEVRFKLIGKKSPAHILAWSLHKFKKSTGEVRKITEKEVLKLLE